MNRVLSVLSAALEQPVKTVIMDLPDPVVHPVKMVHLVPLVVPDSPEESVQLDPTVNKDSMVPPEPLVPKPMMELQVLEEILDCTELPEHQAQWLVLPVQLEHLV